MDKKLLEQKMKKNRALFKKIGLDFDKVKLGKSEDDKVARGFLKGLVEEYTKNVERFADPAVQNYFHNFIATFMLEFHQAYENYDIKIPYRIKAPKSTFDKVLEYLTRKDKSEYSLNEAGEMQGRLKEPIKDMLAATIVATNRSPLFSYSKDPELKDLIEEQKRNYALLEEMQSFQDKITEGFFSGKRNKIYNYGCSREEYYLNCMILINRIKTLIHPEAKNLLQKYDDMLKEIEKTVPKEFFKVASRSAQDQEISESLKTTEHIDLARKLTYRFIDESQISKEESEWLSEDITADDTKVINFSGILDDFTARIHDKLDLAVLTKQVKSVFDKSKRLQKFGITIDEEKFKKMRTTNGYVSNFITLITPYGPVELQLQSQHENREGNYGYSAHCEMEGKGFKEFPIPKEGDEEGLDRFRKCVEFVSPHKFLAQFDNSEPNRILTQVFGKYQNYKAILSQVQKGTIRSSKVKRYLEKLYAMKNKIFEGEAEQEEIECFTYYDIERYVRSEEFKGLQADWEQEQIKEENNGTSYGD